MICLMKQMNMKYKKERSKKMNYVVLMGNILSLEEKDENCSMKIAVQRNEKDENGNYKTDNFNCILHGNLKKAQDYLNKGDEVFISGEVHYDENTSSIYITIHKLVFMDTNSKDNEQVKLLEWS